MSAYSLRLITLDVCSSKVSLLRAKSLHKSKLFIQKHIERSKIQSSRPIFNALSFKLSFFSRWVLPWVGPKETQEYALLAMIYSHIDQRIHQYTWLELVRNRSENNIEHRQDLVQIKRNRKDRQVSVHRVAQLVYRESLRPNQHAIIFDNAYEQLLAAFPTTVNGLPMRNNREECPKYAEHVTVLAERFDEYRLDAQKLSHARDFSLYIAACAS